MTTGNGPRKKKRKKIQHGLSDLEKRRLKDRLLRTCCSEAWVDAQFASIYDRAPDGTEIAVVVHLAHVYPPPAETSPQILCRCCGRWTPPGAISFLRDQLVCPRCGTRHDWHPPAEECQPCSRCRSPMACRGTVAECTYCGARRPIPTERFLIRPCWRCGQELGEQRVQETGICLDCYVGGRHLEEAANRETGRREIELRWAAERLASRQDAWQQSPWHTFMEVMRLRELRLPWD